MHWSIWLLDCFALRSLGDVLDAYPDGKRRSQSAASDWSVCTRGTLSIHISTTLNDFGSLEQPGTDKTAEYKYGRLFLIGIVCNWKVQRILSTAKSEPGLHQPHPRAQRHQALSSLHWLHYTGLFLYLLERKQWLEALVAPWIRLSRLSLRLPRLMYLISLAR